MKRALVACLLVLALAGWGGCGRNVKRTPVPAQCEAMCFVPCVDNVIWEGDPNDSSTWDALGGEVVPALRELNATCEIRRKACAQCLLRLDKTKVIDLGR